MLDNCNNPGGILSCCDICKCIDVVSSKNSVEINRQDCKIDLNINANTLANAITINSATCITILKEFVDGKLTFTPVFDLDCVSKYVCQKCITAPVCVPVFYDNITIIPNATVGVPYSYSRPLNGTAPLTISGTKVKPNWMSINIVGNFLTFTGTPSIGDVSTNIPIQVGISNSCGFSSLTTKFDVSSVVVPCPTITAPVLNSNNVTNAMCPYNLNSLTTNPGTGFSIEWHNQNNIDVNTLVANPASVSSGTYYAFVIQNGTRCASPSSTVVVTCAASPVCIPVNFATVSTLPNANQNQPYSYTISLTGSTPFSVSGLVKPSWLNIAAFGSNLVFSGTPLAGDVTSLASVSYTVTNACGTKTGTSNINVIAAPPVCVNVTFVNTPNFPSATVGVPYSYNVSVQGTDPIVLSSTRPTWMQVTRSGNTFTFAGTPTTVGTGSVNLTFTNCSTGSITHVQSIAVAEAPATCRSYTLSNEASAIGSATYRYGICTGGITSIRSLTPGSSVTFCAVIDSVEIFDADRPLILTDNGPCTTQPCVNVSFAGSTALPGGTVNVPYNATINLNGTVPFTISAINKPTWMQINPSGSSYVISGTPDVTGNVNVSFTITNCGTATATFNENLFIAADTTCIGYTLFANTPSTISWTDCAGVPQTSGTITGSYNICTISGTYVVTSGDVSQIGGQLACTSPEPPGGYTFEYGATNLDTTVNDYTEAQYVAGVDAVYTAGTQTEVAYTPGVASISVPFGNTTDKVLFVAVPNTEAAFTLWSEVGNPLQQNQPIDQAFAGTNVFFKTTRGTDKVYLTRFQTQFTGTIILSR